MTRAMAITSAVGFAGLMFAGAADAAIYTNSDNALQDRASGAQWAPTHSYANATGREFVVGYPGNNLATTGQLRFDVSALVAAGYTSASSTVDYMKVRLYSTGGSTAGATALTVNLYAIPQVDGDWTDNGSYNYKDGVSAAWSVAGAKYQSGNLVATATITPSTTINTLYEITIDGATAKTLVDAWTSGQNYGLAFSFGAIGTAGNPSLVNNRFVAFAEDMTTGGGKGPELELSYVVPEPSSLAVLGLAGLMSLRRRRQG